MQLPGEFSPFIEKKCFLLSGRGGFTLPTPLMVRPLKKHFFYVCLPFTPQPPHRKNVIVENLGASVIYSWLHDVPLSQGIVFGKHSV